jgi:hypothetical protein
MSQPQALEIIYWFLEDVFGLKKDDLLSTYPVDFSGLTGLPHPDKSEAFFRIFNANVLMVQGLAKINQHIPFTFDMVLRPEEYTDDWKLVIS